MFMMNGLDRTNAHDFTSSCDATARLEFTKLNQIAQYKDKVEPMKYQCHLLVGILMAIFFLVFFIHMFVAVSVMK